MNNSNLILVVVGLGFLFVLFHWTRKNPKQIYQEYTDPRRGEIARDSEKVIDWLIDTFSE